MLVRTMSQYFTVEVGVMDYKWFITMKTCKYVFFIIGGAHDVYGIRYTVYGILYTVYIYKLLHEFTYHRYRLIADFKALTYYANTYLFFFLNTRKIRPVEMMVSCDEYNHRGFRFI
jgi:hypothetical protein